MKIGKEQKQSERAMHRLIQDVSLAVLETDLAHHNWLWALRGKIHVSTEPISRRAGKTLEI